MNYLRFVEPPYPRNDHGVRDIPQGRLEQFSPKFRQVEDENSIRRDWTKEEISKYARVYFLFQQSSLGRCICHITKDLHCWPSISWKLIKITNGISSKRADTLGLNMERVFEYMLAEKSLLLVRPFSNGKDLGGRRFTREGPAEILKSTVF